MIDAISVYSGGGGIDLGAHQTGKIRIKVAIDHDPSCCETLRHNFPDTEVIEGRVSDYVKSLPKAKLAYGGPPCQDFSTANSGKKFDLTEVKIFEEIITNLKPDYFLMENVPNLHSKFNHISSQLINCADYGVPQTRKRRFWTNLKRPISTHAESPQNNLFGHTLKKWVSVREALSIDGNFVLDDRRHSFYDKINNVDRKYSIDEPLHTMTTDDRNFLVKKPELYIYMTGFAKCNQIEITRSIDQPSPTIVTSQDLTFSKKRVFSKKYMKLEELESKNLPCLQNTHQTH